MKTKAMVLAVAIVSASTLSLWAQGGNTPSGPSQSGPSASQGSATIENQIIAYDLLGQIATLVADKVATKCSCKTVLLADPNEQSEVISAKAFELSVSNLKDAYDALAPKTEKLAAVSITDIANLLTAIKSSATFSNQNFQPTTQSMINLLSIALNKKGLPLRTSSLPGNLDQGSKAAQDNLNKISDARKSAITRIQGISEKDVRAAAEKALADLDKEFSAFRTALTATSPDGTVLATIIKGETLLSPSGASYSILTVSVDAAGGDTKVTHFFWRELFWPTPNPSYNGGAVVSFLLTDQNGNFQDGYLFHYMYGFSKFKTQKIPKALSEESPPKPKDDSEPAR